MNLEWWWLRIGSGNCYSHLVCTQIKGFAYLRVKSIRLESVFLTHLFIPQLFSCDSKLDKDHFTRYELCQSALSKFYAFWGKTNTKGKDVERKGKYHWQHIMVAALHNFFHVLAATACWPYERVSCPCQSCEGLMETNIPAFLLLQTSLYNISFHRFLSCLPCTTLSLM